MVIYRHVDMKVVRIASKIRIKPRYNMYRKKLMNGVQIISIATWNKIEISLAKECTWEQFF